MFNHFVNQLSWDERRYCGGPASSEMMFNHFVNQFSWVERRYCGGPALSEMMFNHFVNQLSWDEGGSEGAQLYRRWCLTILWTSYPGMSGGIEGVQRPDGPHFRYQGQGRVQDFSQDRSDFDACENKNLGFSDFAWPLPQSSRGGAWRPGPTWSRPWLRG